MSTYSPITENCSGNRGGNQGGSRGGNSGGNSGTGGNSSRRNGQSGNRRRSRNGGSSERIRPLKSLGQHFLTDGAYINKIISSAELTKNDIVLEIGPGEGALTGKLCRAAGRVAAVEIDRRLAFELERTISGEENIDIIFADILKTDILKIIADEKSLLAAKDESIKNPSIKVIGNLPYYITSPVIMKILELGVPAMLLLMVQNEVAERMTASPGGRDYGVLSIMTQYYAVPEILFTVPPSAFRPAPKVLSAVIRMHVRREPPVTVADKTFLFSLIKASFMQRRKTLENSVYNSGITGLGKEDITEAIKTAGIAAGSRAETLSLGQFNILADILGRYAADNCRHI